MKLLKQFPTFVNPDFYFKESAWNVNTRKSMVQEAFTLIRHRQKQREKEGTTQLPKVRLGVDLNFYILYCLLFQKMYNNTENLLLFFFGFLLLIFLSWLICALQTIRVPWRDFSALNTAHSLFGGVFRIKNK